MYVLHMLLYLDDGAGAEAGVLAKADVGWHADVCLEDEVEAA